jgi:hypothetical protein
MRIIKNPHGIDRYNLRIPFSGRAGQLLRRVQVGGPLRLAEYERAERIIAVRISGRTHKSGQLELEFGNSAAFQQPG